MTDTRNAKTELLILLFLTVAVLTWSGIGPYDRATWWMEVAPVVLGIPALIATYPYFPMTRILYRLLLLHAVILVIGGHYTYARVPMGFWFQDWLDLARNHYDRLGHLAQGFIPAILAREILLRTSVLRPGKWLSVIVVCICLAFSAFYEMLEWWTALLAGSRAEDFLATQGDIWDTQWDMFLALIGAITAVVVLSRVHDRALAKAGLVRKG
jgi:putative membrane protein